jgi:hypothetical protein
LSLGQDNQILPEALVGSEQLEEAQREAQRVLSVVHAQADSVKLTDIGHFPIGFDHFRVEWERAAWANAGDPASEAREKRNLIRWRLHSLLAETTGDLSHAYEAAVARPDLPSSRSVLGCTLARHQRPADVIPHLRRALADNPFDLQTASALFKALGDAGDGMGQRRLARELRLLARAAPSIVPLQNWMARTPPAGDELVSIIILCCDGLEDTTPCLESLLACTRSPYELVIVDNGSTDGTAEYLKELSQHQGPERVAILRNEKNIGYAAGCNQAIRQARGDYLVFLNNDVVLTPGWLEPLVHWSLADWPSVGMVGPVSNYAPPPQQVEPEYRTIQELNSFAGRLRGQCQGKAQMVERLTGFCLLVRREVIEKVGAFDEGYGIGFFEDDD